MLVLLDLHPDNYNKQDTVDFEIVRVNGRLCISLDDGCDIVSGYIRSVEDVETIINKLNKYLEGLNASKRVD